MMKMTTTLDLTTTIRDAGLDCMGPAQKVVQTAQMLLRVDLPLEYGNHFVDGRNGTITTLNQDVDRLSRGWDLLRKLVVQEHDRFKTAAGKYKVSILSKTHLGSKSHESKF